MIVDDDNVLFTNLIHQFVNHFGKIIPTKKVER